MHFLREILSGSGATKASRCTRNRVTVSPFANSFGIYPQHVGIEILASSQIFHNSCFGRDKGLPTILTSGNHCAPLPWHPSHVVQTMYHRTRRQRYLECTHLFAEWLNVLLLNILLRHPIVNFFFLGNPRENKCVTLAR